MTGSNSYKSKIAGVQAASVSGTQVSDRAAALPMILATALLGAFIVFGVGFAHSTSLHNAAHDTRHAVGFPCH
ncbi:CbtB domain-containing protein [Breoghania sp. L-A4]|uniref:CbtB domain-containing protein n=1 Tax=Breoghania sp. L-A4 TaxID=2304600 RepID=UPI000E35F0F9|nr:CbtB domain-containing protein [Breoghania sp. L-A4]AXS42618.1 cobalt transporter [Breoghania sp. L-A4]